MAGRITRNSLDSHLSAMTKTKNQTAQGAPADKQMYIDKIEKLNSDNAQLMENIKLLKKEHAEKVKKLASDSAAEIEKGKKGFVDDITKLKAENTNLMAKVELVKQTMKTELDKISADKNQELENLKQLLNQQKDLCEQTSSEAATTRSNLNTLITKYAIKKERLNTLGKDKDRLEEALECEKKKTARLESELIKIGNKSTELESLLQQESEKTLKVQQCNEENLNVINQLKEQLKVSESSLAESKANEESARKIEELKTKLANYEVSLEELATSKKSCSKLLIENDCLKKDVERYKETADRYWRSKKIMESSKKAVVRNLNRYKDALIESQLKQNGVALPNFEPPRHHGRQNFDDRNNSHHSQWNQDRSRSRSRGDRSSGRPFAPYNRREFHPRESRPRESHDREPRNHHRH